MEAPRRFRKVERQARYDERGSIGITSGGVKTKSGGRAIRSGAGATCAGSPAGRMPPPVTMRRRRCRRVGAPRVAARCGAATCLPAPTGTDVAARNGEAPNTGIPQTSSRLSPHPEPTSRARKMASKGPAANRPQSRSFAECATPAARRGHGAAREPRQSCYWQDQVTAFDTTICPVSRCRLPGVVPGLPPRQPIALWLRKEQHVVSAASAGR